MNLTSVRLLAPHLTSRITGACSSRPVGRQGPRSRSSPRRSGLGPMPRRSSEAPGARPYGSAAGGPRRAGSAIPSSRLTRPPLLLPMDPRSASGFSTGPCGPSLALPGGRFRSRSLQLSGCTPSASGRLRPGRGRACSCGLPPPGAAFGRRHGTLARPLQGPGHHRRRHAREAAARQGPAASRPSVGRRSRHPGSRSHGVARRPHTEEVRCHRETAPRGGARPGRATSRPR